MRKYICLAASCLLFISACRSEPDTNDMNRKTDRIGSYLFQASSMELLEQNYYLPFVELVAKWNSLASEAAIPEYGLDKKKLHLEPNQCVFEYSFDDNMHLSGVCSSDGSITAMTFRAKNIPNTHYEMLMYWSLMIAVTNLQVMPSEVDRYYEELNIEPNGNIAGAVGQHVMINNAKYQVDKVEEQYVFSFQKTKPLSEVE